MAIAKRNVSVSRGYKPKTARAAQRGPNVFQRAARMLRQTTREMVDMTCDEIADATADTMQLLEFLRYVMRRETRARVAPVMHEWETFVHEHEQVKEVGAFAVEQVNGINVRTFKR